MFLLKLTFTHWHIVKRRFHMVVRPYNPSSHIKVNLSNQQRFLLLILKVTSPSYGYLPLVLTLLMILKHSSTESKANICLFL